MTVTFETRALTHDAVMTMLAAGVAQAERIGAPQCIVIVDASGEPLGEIRMNGSRFLSRKTSLAKARTAASINAPSTSLSEAMLPKLASATGGAVTGLAGGLPIRIDGMLVGGIGVGSGTPEQDVDVARAALAAIGAEMP